MSARVPGRDAGRTGAGQFWTSVGAFSAASVCLFVPLGKEAENEKRNVRMWRSSFGVQSALSKLWQVIGWGGSWKQRTQNALCGQRALEGFKEESQIVKILNVFPRQDSYTEQFMDIFEKCIQRTKLPMYIYIYSHTQKIYIIKQSVT